MQRASTSAVQTACLGREQRRLLSSSNAEKASRPRDKSTAELSRRLESQARVANPWADRAECSSSLLECTVLHSLAAKASSLPRCPALDSPDTPRPAKALDSRAAKASNPPP